MGQACASSAFRCAACRRSWPVCGSRTCPTSTSDCPRGAQRAVERAVDWVVERQPDLTLISGDLVSRPRGERKLLELVERLPSCYAVLGNHDLADTRDPFGRRSRSLELGAATLLADDSRTVELRGRRVQIAGVDPRTYVAGLAHPDKLSDPTADLRVLLCHFPGGDRQAKAGLIRSRPRRTPARGPDLRAVPRAVACASRTCAGATSRVCTSARPGRCTSRPASARRSFRSVSWRGRRREPMRFADRRCATQSAGRAGCRNGV